MEDFINELSEEKDGLLKILIHLFPNTKFSKAVGPFDFRTTCPFCKHDRPSLLLNEKSKTFKCFACKRNGIKSHFLKLLSILKREGPKKFSRYKKLEDERSFLPIQTD